MKNLACLAAFAALAVADDDGSLYISGQMQTREKYTYGKFRGACSGPGKKGTTVGFFTQWTGPDWDFTKWNSIEMEIVPSMANPLSLDLSYGDGTNRIEYQNFQPGFQPTDQEHVYEFTWSPNEVNFSVDDKLLKTYSKGNPGVDQQTKSQNIIFNMWAPRYDAHEDDWSAGRDDWDMPWYASCDWIEYHAYDAASDSFSLTWRDDFDGDSIDMNRWEFANNSTWD